MVIGSCSSVKIDPVEFELKAFKLQPSTFWNSGYLELVGSRGEKRKFPLRELGRPPMKFMTDNDVAVVKVSITGYAVVCGEYADETARSYSITVSGPQEKLELLQKSSLEAQGFTIVK